MIQDKSILVDVNISVWTGKKMDKKVSQEIDAAKNTKTKAGNYSKHLLAGTDKLDTLSKMVANIRNWHYQQTLPWSDSGSRLLPMKNFFEYKQTLSYHEQEFSDAVEDFLTEYPNLVSAAAFQLGDLFDRDEYPTAEELRSKFKFKYVFLPVADVNDFRVQVGEESSEELREQYEKFYTDKLNGAMKESWERLHDALTKISERLADGEDGEKKIFRDSMFTNAMELCAMLTRLNVTDDPKLEEARKKLEKAIAGVDAKDVRDDEALRKDVKQRVDDILGAFDF
jgi:hypothetical protein